MPQPVELTNQDDFTEMLAKSYSVPVLLYKHSVSCPISGHAWYEVEDCLENGDPAPACYRLTVQTQPDLSRDIAESLNVIHHTPQIIVVRRGKADFVASHWQIRRQTLQRAISAASAHQTPE